MSNLSLDVHYYDQWVKANFHLIAQHLPPVTPDEFMTCWKEIFHVTENPQIVEYHIDSQYIQPLRQTVEYVYKKNDVDPNTGFNCNLLGASVWKTIRQNKDGIRIFMNQFIDMFLTNGTCPMGQTQRYLQVFVAFKGDKIPFHQSQQDDEMKIL